LARLCLGIFFCVVLFVCVAGLSSGVVCLLLCGRLVRFGPSVVCFAFFLCGLFCFWGGGRGGGFVVCGGLFFCGVDFLCCVVRVRFVFGGAGVLGVGFGGWLRFAWDWLVGDAVGGVCVRSRCLGVLGVWWVGFGCGELCGCIG